MRNHGSPFRPHLALLLLCLPCLCDSSGQRPELVIRTNVQVVQVSIVATGAHNLPVTDLQARDFRVWDSGSEQVITKLERVSSTQPLSAQPLPPGVYSNRAGKAGEPQVLSMILLDALNTKFRLQATTRGAVEKILNETTPGERIALYTYGLQLKLLHDFSSDKDSLLAALRLPWRESSR
jgi:VWFA-related protein